MVVSFVRAELQIAREFGQQLLHLASRRHDSTLLLEAHFPLGATLFHLGEFVQAREYLERGVALYDAQQHHSAAFLYGGYDPGVMILSYTAWVLWFLGYVDQSLQRIREALSLAHKLSHPQSLAIALSFAAFIHQLRREGQAAQTQSEAGMALCAEQGLSYWLAESSILRGWALLEKGQWEKGISQIREGLDARPRGTELDRSHYLILLAEGYGKSQQVGEGLALLAEALDGMGRTGDCYYEAELYRMKGELTLQKFQVLGSKFQVPSSTQPPTPSTQEAEGCFHKAIEVARKQQAKSLELRAVTSLARLWQRQGKRDDARQMLAEVYIWFTEGFDTKDLQEARALLEQL
jgi:predicted ATPase